MFSDVMVGVLFGLGFGAWVYSKMHHQTGGNTKSALVVAGFAGLGGFLFIITLLQILF